MRHPEMKVFWRKAGWSLVGTIELWAVFMAFFLMGPVSWVVPAVAAVVIAVVWVILVCIWWVNLPDRCRMCGKVYDKCVHFTVANLNSGRPLDLSKCGDCTDTVLSMRVKK